MAGWGRTRLRNTRGLKSGHGNGNGVDIWCKLPTAARRAADKSQHPSEAHHQLKGSRVACGFSQSSTFTQLLPEFPFCLVQDAAFTGIMLSGSSSDSAGFMNAV